MEASAFEQYLEAWNDHDIDRLLEFFTDDCVYEDVALGRINKGKEELRKFAEETFETFPDFGVVDERGVFGASHGRFASEWTMSGTHEGDQPGFPATHKRFSVRGGSVAVAFNDEDLIHVAISDDGTKIAGRVQGQGPPEAVSKELLGFFRSDADDRSEFAAQ